MNVIICGSWHVCKIWRSLTWVWDDGVIIDIMDNDYMWLWTCLPNLISCKFKSLIIYNLFTFYFFLVTKYLLGLKHFISLLIYSVDDILPTMLKFNLPLKQLWYLVRTRNTNSPRLGDINWEPLDYKIPDHHN